MDRAAIPQRIVMSITGASGAPYGRALLKALVSMPLELHLTVSSSALIVMREELGITFGASGFDAAEFIGQPVPPGRLVMHHERDMAAPIASGSFRHQGMVICPCSMKTLGVIAHGTGDSLTARAADATLKERRRLVLVPRETPLNLVHLRNMTAVTEAGAVVLPAMPGFYHRPQSIDDLVNHLVLKILDNLGLEHGLSGRWKDNG